MAQQLKTFEAMSNNVSSNPMIEEKNLLLQINFWTPHVCCDACAYSTYTDEINKQVHVEECLSRNGGSVTGASKEDRHKGDDAKTDTSLNTTSVAGSVLENTYSRQINNSKEQADIFIKLDRHFSSTECGYIAYPA